MKVKRFFAPDMHNAMRLVRDEVGADAVILSSDRVAGGVEVVVAVDSTPAVGKSFLDQQEMAQRKERQLSALTSGRKPARKEGRRDGLEKEIGRVRAGLAAEQGRVAQAEALPFLRPVKDKQLRQGSDDCGGMLLDRQQSSRLTPQGSRSVESHAPQAGGDEVLAMRRELDELKSMLRAQLQTTAPVQQHLPDAIETDATLLAIKRRFERMGLSPALVQRLVSGIEPGLALESAWKTVLARLSDALPVVGESIVERGGIIAFVGATGVGKTTSIGKLAAQYVLQHGSSGVALVTTDSYRIAAHEQLRTFGRILDVPVRVVDEHHCLDEVLGSLRHKRLVLVDTAGMSTSEQQKEEVLAMLGDSSFRIKKFLVLPCTAQRQVLEMACAHFKPLGLNGCVLSKLDESVSLGEAISVVAESRLPVAYLADGQKIPDNIEVARSRGLISRAVVVSQRQVKQPVDESVSFGEGSVVAPSPAETRLLG
jgi:flagellar biosynthesis protein FlhF